MTSSDSLACVDTNVLVYAQYDQAHQHPQSRSLLDRAQAGEVDLCITPQIIAEFYATVTNSRRVTSPYSASEAIDLVDCLLAMPGMTLLPHPADLVSRMTALLRQQPVVGRRVFDAQLAASILGNGVRRLYTFNGADFQHFQDLEVLTP